MDPQATVAIFLFILPIPHTMLTYDDADIHFDQGGISLVSILGLSWISGFLYFTSSLSWMGTVFTITNSSQVRENLTYFFFKIFLKGFDDLYMSRDPQ